MEEWFHEKAQGAIFFRQDQINVLKLSQLDELLHLLEYVMIIVVQGDLKQDLIS